MGARRLAVLAALGALALWVEWLAYDGGSLGLAAADLAVGLAFLVSGVVVWNGRGVDRMALLFLATGVAWFLGTLAASDVAALSSVGSALLYAHRGPFVQLVLAYPTGTVRSRLDRLVVAVAWVDGVVVSVAQDDVVTLVLAVAVVGAAGAGLRSESPSLRRSRRLATTTAALVAAALALVAASSVAGSTLLSDTTLLLAYEATLIVAALVLAGGLLAERVAPADVADIVVDLGSAPRSGSVRDALARAFDDPSLELGYRVGSDYVDAGGEPISLPASGSGRVARLVGREGEAIAVLVHDESLSADPALAEAVAAAARLSAVNARLQAELRAQVSELAASRRRSLEAADAQRSRLERRLSNAAELHLETMRGALARARSCAPAGVAASLAVLERELDVAIVELHELARGIHPHTLTERGLAAALAELATAGPTPVSVKATGERFPQEVEAAAYFVCAEALANVAKYARASLVSVDVSRTDAGLRVHVSDDGIGGANPSRGSGLRGLADRVDSAGGRLVVTSPPSRGTSLLAEIPLERSR